jgi:hypothetical protein
MAERIAASIMSFSLGFRAQELQTPKGGEACIAAQRLEYRTPQTYNTNVSSVDAACGQNKEQ